MTYLEDPVQALRAIAARVRPGGLVAFQELDLDPGVSARSLPEQTLYDETGRLVTTPGMCEEALIGGGPNFAGYAWVAGVARSLAPLMQKLGVASTEELDLDTLAERIRDDAVARGAVVWGPPLIGAYAAKGRRQSA